MPSTVQYTCCHRHTTLWYLGTFLINPFFQFCCHVQSPNFVKNFYKFTRCDIWAMLKENHVRWIFLLPDIFCGVSVHTKLFGHHPKIIKRQISPDVKFHTDFGVNFFRRQFIHFHCNSVISGPWWPLVM